MKTFKLWLKFTAICLVIWLFSGTQTKEEFLHSLVYFYLTPIGIYLVFRLIKSIRSFNENSKEIKRLVPLQRDEYAKKVNKEIFYFNEYRGIAFNKETKKFEYLKIELPNGEKFKQNLL